MEENEKGKAVTQVSRRDVLKGMSAVAAVSVAGCATTSKPAQDVFKKTQASPAVPAVTGTEIYGSTPHNCGGRCVSKYYLEKGVVKRIVTDEREDKGLDEGNDPQRRSCIRCHSRKEWFYRADRLMYPLKQTKERGDVAGFVRISWEQAYHEIGEQLEKIYGKYGAERVFICYMSGDSTGWARNSAKHLLNTAFGGFAGYRSNYSHPALEHIGSFVDGKSGSLWGNGYVDAVNADELVLWGFNALETIHGSQHGWILTQIKEKGVPVTVVDTRVSMSANSLAKQLITPLPGTDGALVLAMMHHMLTKRFNDMDIDFIKSHVHGFFDDSQAKSYHADVKDYTVPAGASLSAFIMGNNDLLVKRGLNEGTSIYPATIGYNVNPDDELYGKRAPIYGQMEKTPEWAEEICGVPAKVIRNLADRYLDQKVFTLVGGGIQRNSESEQLCWLGRIMTAITKNFGQSGASWGINLPLKAKAPSDGLKKKAIDIDNYDVSELSVPRSYLNYKTDKNLPVFLWLDNVENDLGKSKWNDGQAKNLRSFKALINFAGNALANQSGDINYSKKILADRSKAELIVTCDHFMTTSASLSDYVLPGAMAMEKPGAVSGWRTNDVVAVQNVLTPPAEAKDEYEICAGIAAAMGKKDAFLEGKTMEQRLAEGWKKNQDKGIYDISWEEFKKEGIWKAPTPPMVHNGKFFSAPAKNPLGSPSGKYEAYSKWMMEDYQGRHHNNLDPAEKLIGGTIADNKHPQGSNAARFVYPIPMYIPTIEGRHAVTSGALAHPDLLGLEKKGYEFTLHTWHVMYRSHSTLNKVAYLDEQFKKDGNGQPAFIDPNKKSLAVWEDGVYEPVVVNQAHAKETGLKTGDRVIIENDVGAIYASIIFSETVPPNVIYIGQGSWHQPDKDGVDVGGCANTLTKLRPSRICKGMTLGNDVRVKMMKA